MNSILKKHLKERYELHYRKNRENLKSMLPHAPSSPAHMFSNSIYLELVSGFGSTALTQGRHRLGDRDWPEVGKPSTFASSPPEIEKKIK